MLPATCKNEKKKKLIEKQVKIMIDKKKKSKKAFNVRLT